MTLNMTGVEVASGVYDPSIMFNMVGVILGIGFVVLVGAWLYNNYK